MKYVLVVVFFVTGCSQMAKDMPPKSWISVTSPPTQTILLIDSSKVTDDLICKVIRDTKKGKYYNYPFNASTTIAVNVDIEKHGSESFSESSSNSLTLSDGE